MRSDEVYVISLLLLLFSLFKLEFGDGGRANSWVVGERCAFYFCWQCLADQNVVGRYGNHYHDHACPHWREPD